MKEEMKKNAIIILNYNDFENIYIYFNNLKNFKNLDEIIIVDNSSTDNSKENLKKLNHKKLKTIFLSENNGYGAGNNAGINYLKNKKDKYNIIISNADIVITQGAFNKLISTINNNNNNIKILAPTIVENNELNRGWKLSNIKDEIYLSIGHDPNEIIGYSNDYYVGKLTKVDVVSGCFFVIDSDFCPKKLFDENVFLYYEENIISKKLKTEMYIANKIKITHKKSSSINKSINKYKKTKMLKKSQEYYVKNYCEYNILQYMILKFLNCIVLSLSYIKMLLFK